jgi:hypothetical protein
MIQSVRRSNRIARTLYVFVLAHFLSQSRFPHFAENASAPMPCVDRMS